MTRAGPLPQYLPGRNEQPWFYPDYPPALPTPGRWVWIPDRPTWPSTPVWDEPVWGSDTVTVAIYESSSVAHVGQH